MTTISASPNVGNSADIPHAECSGHFGAAGRSSLGLQKGFVTKPFRHVRKWDEWPIWGPLEQAVEADVDADQIKSPQSLLMFLSKYFAKPILDNICGHLDEMTNSWLGQRYSLRGTYANYAKNVIHNVVSDIEEMIADASRADRTGGTGGTGGTDGRGSDSRGGRGGTGQGRGQGRGHGRGHGSGRGTAGGQGGNAGDGRSTGTGGNSAKAGGSASGRYRSREEPRSAVDLLNFGHGLRGCENFCSVEYRQVRMKEFTTPKNVAPHADDTIYRRSQAFVDAVKGIWDIPDEYDPKKLDGEQPYVYLYNGTQTSSIGSFKMHGICPPSPVAQDFSRKPAFYTTNSLRAAYEHVLHRTPGVSKDPATRDSVTIFIFRVPSTVLHGVSPCKDEYQFTLEWFVEGSEEEDERWENFVKMNRNRHLPPTSAVTLFDVVIGSISQAKEQEEAPRGAQNRDSGGKDSKIGILKDLETGKRPQQVVMTADMSQCWIPKHLHLALCEVWMPPEKVNTNAPISKRQKASNPEKSG